MIYEQRDSMNLWIVPVSFGSLLTVAATGGLSSNLTLTQTILDSIIERNIGSKFKANY